MQPLSGVRHHEDTDGARTRGDKAKAERVIKLLNDALATKILCILRYKRHYSMTTEVSFRRVKEKFSQYVTDERADADYLAKRMDELGSKPEFSPARLLKRYHAERVNEESLVEMIAADLLAEQIAIEHYRAMITSIGPDDPTTRQVLERILAQEEAHAESLAHLARDYTSE